MDEAQKEIIEGLKTAIRNENDGYHFYSMAAQSIQDEKGRQVFAQLAEEELGHRQFLQAQYRSFLEKGQADPNTVLKQRSEWPGENPIFSEKLKQRIGEAHFEMTALAVGIQLEISSQQYYQAQSDQATEPTVKAFFHELAHWESYHYQTLLKQQEALREDYWSQGGFAPF